MHDNKPTDRLTTSIAFSDVVDKIPGETLATGQLSPSWLRPGNIHTARPDSGYRVATLIIWGDQRHSRRGKRVALQAALRTIPFCLRICYPHPIANLRQWSGQYLPWVDGAFWATLFPALWWCTLVGTCSLHDAHSIHLLNHKAPREQISWVSRGAAIVFIFLPSAVGTESHYHGYDINDLTTWERNLPETSKLRLDWTWFRYVFQIYLTGMGPFMELVILKILSYNGYHCNNIYISYIYCSTALPLAHHCSFQIILSRDRE